MAIKKSINLEAAFRHGYEFEMATHFYDVGQSEHFRLGGPPATGAALCVLDSFASEIYLKCLRFIESNEWPTKDRHNLESLYAGLSDDAKDALKHAYSHFTRAYELAGQSPADKGKPILRWTLEMALSFGANGFEEWRYLFEFDPATGKSTAGWTGISLAPSVRTVIVALKPELGQYAPPPPSARHLFIPPQS